MILLRALVIGLLLLLARPVHSDEFLPSLSPPYNNTIAIAVPLDAIQIDGDLADWPEDMPIYNLREREYAIRPIDAKGALLDTSADFSPHFRVGYNLQEQSIYLAIEARDDTLFEGDASMVYLQMTPAQDRVDFIREYHDEDPDVSNIEFLDGIFLHQESLAKSGVRSAVGRLGDITVYEWALKLAPGDLEKFAADSATRVFFDVGVLDRDNDDDDEFRISWSPNPEKDEEGASLGYLTFAAERSGLVQVQGVLVGEDGTPLPGLKIRTENAEGSWTDEITTGAEGRFSAWARPGDLQVTIRGLAAADTVHLAPGPGARPEVQLVAPHFNEEVRPVLVSAHEPGVEPPFLLEGARFRIGDDPSWAARDFDDSDWEVFGGGQWDFDVPDGSRVIWIRQHLLADREMSSRPLVLKPMNAWADSCTYFLNGSQLANFYPLHPGKADARTTATLGHMEPDLLAIRYSYSSSEYFSEWKSAYNFVLAEASLSFQEVIEYSQISIPNLSIFICMPLMLSVLHLLTFWFYRNQREHFYYALFTACTAGTAIFRVGNEHFNWDNDVCGIIGTPLLFLLLTWSLMRFVGTLFNQEDTPLFKIYQGSAYTVSIGLISILCAILFARYNPLNLAEPDFGERWQFYYGAFAPFAFILIGLFVWLTWKNSTADRHRLTSWSAGLIVLPMFIALVDEDLGQPIGFMTWGIIFLTGTFVLLKATYRALRDRILGSTTIATGILMYYIFVFGAGIYYGSTGRSTPPFEFFSVGFFAIILAISIHLARVVGRTGRSLEEQLVQVETLSQTNLEQERALRQRMEEELEEARQLQLSMLPSQVPQLANVEIDWSMKTATEVGGDYYDYRIADDDRLTLVLGDATGHGMQAGTLVTATKSLFQGLPEGKNLADTVAQISASLKSMHLGRIGMALTMLQLDGRQLRYCPAGIPPMLIYRAQENKVEEGQSGGLPLGITALGRYREIEVALAPGDAVLLMSDGLPERTNEAEGEFGYQRVQELFLEVAQETPKDICSLMAAGGDQWAAGKDQDDDVSFLALRVR